MVIRDEYSHLGPSGKQAWMGANLGNAKVRSLTALDQFDVDESTKVCSARKDNYVVANGREGYPLLLELE
jgi:hypothetical protein